MSIKTDALIIRDETVDGANTALRVGQNLSDIADDLVAKQAVIDLKQDKPIEGAFVNGDKTKLDGITAGATPDQVLPTSGVDFDPVGTDNSDDNAVNTLYSGLATSKQDDLDVVSQVDAEAGIATDERIWTAQRVKQAIDALAGGSGSVDDTAYGISWDGVTGTAPSKNALYDFIESQVFKVDATSNIIPIFWGGTQAEYDIDFPSGHTNEYFIVITDGVVPPTTASDIVFVPNGSIAATDVQAAIQEVRDEASSSGLTNRIIEGKVSTFGDSMTDGQNASSGRDYVDLLEEHFSWVRTQYAVSGRGTWLMAKEHIENIGLDHGNISTLMAGFNDVRRGANGAKTMAKIENCYRSTIVNHFLKSSVSANASNPEVTQSNWNTNYPADTVGGRSSDGKLSTTNGGYLEYSFHDSNVVFGTIAVDGVTAVYGGFDVSIDGNFIGSYNFNEKCDGISDGSNSNYACPAVLVFEDLGYGEHTIRITSTSTTFCVADYFGHIKEPNQCSPIIMIESIKNNALGYAVVPNQANDAIIDELNALLLSVKNTLFVNEYPIILSKTSDYFDVTTGLDVDNIHPNDEGHGQIFEGISESLKDFLIIKNSDIFTSVVKFEEGLRVQGSSGILDTDGVEVDFISNTGYISAYNRISSAWRKLIIRGLSLEFFHNNSKKLETTSTGIKVTGATDSTSYSVGGVAGASGSFVSSDGNTSTVTNGIITDIVAGSAVTTGTGTAIDLTNAVGAYYNIGASSTATAFTVPTVAVGGFAVVESASTTTEPTVTVTGGTATEIPSLAWTASTLMYLNIYSYDGTNVFYYWSDTVSSISGTVAVAERNILNYEENFSTDSNYYQKWVEKENIATGGDLGIGTFRIPTMAHFPNGDCVVAAEGRIGTANDFEVAVIFVSILRNGYTLSKQILRTPTAQENKVGSPNLVAVGSRMYLFYNSFSESGTPNLTNEIKLFYVYSDDSGVTWSAEVEILPDDQNSASTFKYLLSPGNSLVLANGKIMIPIWGKIVADTSPAYYRSGVLVWDVNGTGTFVKRLDNDTEGTAEPSIYIDKDGTTIVMDSRNSELTFRTVRTSIDEGVTWNTHPSNGYTAVAIFTNIKRYADQLMKVEITDGANSGVRQNLNLYVGGLDNVSWNKVQDITERDAFIWGYGAVSYYAGELLVVSEDKPDLNLYKVNIEGSNMLNMFSLTPPSPPTPTLFDYTPVGTIIDTNKWTVFNTDPSKVEITQATDAIVFKDLITQSSGVASEKLSTNGLYSCNTAVEDVFVYFKLTKTNDSFFQLNFNGGLTNNISFRTNANNSNFITLKRVQPTGVDTNTTETLDGEFKLSFVSGTLLVYKWNGSSYVQIISETYTDLHFNIDLIRGVNAVLDETMSVNRITVRNEDWTGVSPVA